ncbi:uncharacterized protein EMH_0099260 [Eimeria mitis]|uniref:Uncharacterized protein n=1 Tax=Eimeria mitis TaxID=44415 RepID=U6KFT0_9EIME|nr:uncharacterized protein EMH_0099260 [Eimeria mitis]CDJ35646.1 hypothetical protein, conserved [Eimeria mitis]
MKPVQDVALPSCGLRGMAVSIYMRVEYVDRRGYGCPVAGIELRRGTARPTEKEKDIYERLDGYAVVAGLADVGSGR